jgi:hypothetical protein
LEAAVHVFVILLAYLFALLLLAGAFVCMYMGGRLVQTRGRAASAKTDFSGKFGGMEFTIGAGSIAALTMALSALWIAAAFLARPKIEFSSNSDGGGGVIRLISQVEVKDPGAIIETVPVELPEPPPAGGNMPLQQRYAQAADASADDAQAAADAAAAAADAAADFAREAQSAQLAAKDPTTGGGWKWDENQALDTAADAAGAATDAAADPPPGAVDDAEEEHR